MSEGEAGGLAAAEQAWNEAALAQPVAAPAWRLWPYDAAAVVLGRAQRADAEAVAARTPLPVLVRASGGGPVLVGPWMLGLSVVLPAGHPLAGRGPVDGYRWLGEGVAAVLDVLGVPAVQALSPDLARRRGADPAIAWACFGGLSPWEVVTAGRKVVGLAQVRRRHGVLVVGGVLLDAPPWERLCEAVGRPASHADALRAATAGCVPARAADPSFAPRLAERIGGMLAAALGDVRATAG